MNERILIRRMLTAMRGSAGPDEINNVREAADEYLAAPEQSEPVAWISNSGWTTSSIAVYEHEKAKGNLLTPLYK